MGEAGEVSFRLEFSDQSTGIFVASLSDSTCSADFDQDGDTGTDADIEAFFACIAGSCCPTCQATGADFDNDGDSATDADIEAFFRALGGNPC
jgi:hypothetical protein